MSTIPSNLYAQIEAVVNKLPKDAQADARSLFQGLSNLATQTAQAVGIGSGANAQNVSVPPQATLTVTAENGAFTLSIQNPTLPTPATIYHQISYSTVKGFTSGVTTLAVTAATSLVQNLPSQTLFWRIRSSFNQQTWNNYSLASETAVSSGLVSSAATSNGGAFNQTNLATVTSAASGSNVSVNIQGSGGAHTNLVALKGGVETVLPGATIVGVAPGTTQFVGYDSDTGEYNLHPTLAGVLTDNQIPIGRVSVVNLGAPTLPSLAAVVSGGFVVGASFVAPNFKGSGLSAVPTLTVSDPAGPGTGATAIITGVTAGACDGVQVTNGGDGHYDSHTTITASGGIFPGDTGGGTAAGGNGGRMTNV